MEHEPQLSPQEIYEDKILSHVNLIVNNLENRRQQDHEQGKVPSQLADEQYLSVAHSVVTGLLERENIGKTDNQFDISATGTFETGEFRVVSPLMQSVPGYTQQVLEVLEGSSEERRSNEPWRESTVDTLITFSEAFEELIIVKVLEEKNKEE